MQAAALCFIDSSDLLVYGLLALFMFIIILAYVLIDRAVDSASRAFKKATASPDCVPNSSQPQRLADRFNGIWIPPALPPVQQFTPQPSVQQFTPQQPVRQIAPQPMMQRSVPKQQFCAECGTPFQPGAKFCKRCGKPL